MKKALLIATIIFTTAISSNFLQTEEISQRNSTNFTSGISTINEIEEPGAAH